jgi:hypothetical protein
VTEGAIVEADGAFFYLYCGPARLYLHWLQTTDASWIGLSPGGDDGGYAELDVMQQIHVPEPAPSKTPPDHREFLEQRGPA